ncbi:MAG: sulfatase-like hydrolase/transferase, partial [Rhodospirillaceae bacterium]|nr:sulfatase-like hydrolase/transferase [Rhodospirillaceae bacterium]
AYFLAQVEAMDTLIGQLLDGIPPDVMENTYVIFLGDNGTDKWADPPAPRDAARVKMTVYEGGVNVPLIVTGPGIAGGRVERPLAHVVDLFATVLELAEANPETVLPRSLTIDSVSMAPDLFEEDLPSRRSWVLSEGRVGTFNGIAIRDERYKLLLMNESEEFYDIEADPNELRPLSLQSLSAEARASYGRLKELVEHAISE